MRRLRRTSAPSGAYAQPCPTVCLTCLPGVPMTSGYGASAGAPLVGVDASGVADEVVGQDHLLAPGLPLRHWSRARGGVGDPTVLGQRKTTLAALISQATGRRFEALSALSAGVKEAWAVIENSAKSAVSRASRPLFIDEVHRFSKIPTDAPAVSGGTPGGAVGGGDHREPAIVSVVAPLLSRSPLILQLRPLTAEDTRAVVQRAIDDPAAWAGQSRKRSRPSTCWCNCVWRRPARPDRAGSSGRGSPGIMSLVSVQTIERSVTKPRCATTVTATSTDVVSSSSNRCAVPTSMPRCTIWPAGWSPGRTRGSSPAG